MGMLVLAIYSVVPGPLAGTTSALMSAKMTG
jgi:hypothetical protein